MKKKLWIIPGILFLAASCAVLYSSITPKTDSGPASPLDFVPIAKIDGPGVIPCFSSHVIKFSPDGKLVAYGGEWTPLIVLDAVTRRVIWLMPESKNDLDCSLFTERPLIAEPVISWCTSISFSPNGSLLATAGHGAGILIYNAFNGNKIAQFSPKDSDVSFVAFSPNEKILAAGMAIRNSSDKDKGNSAVIIYDSSNWSLLNKIYYEDFDIKCILFTSDGAKVIVAGDDTLSILDGLKWNKTWSMNLKNRIEDLCISPNNSNMVLSASDLEGGPLEIWDIQKEPFLFRSVIIKFPAKISISHDSKYCLLGGKREICLLDMETLQFVREYQKIGDVGAVAFSPDYKIFAAGPFIFGPGEKKSWAETPAEEESDLVIKGHTPVIKISHRNFISESAALYAHWDLKVHKIFREIDVGYVKKAQEENCEYILDKIKSAGENSEPMKIFFQQNITGENSMWTGDAGVVPCYVDKIIVWGKPMWVIVCNWEYNSSYLGHVAIYLVNPETGRVIAQTRCG